MEKNKIDRQEIARMLFMNSECTLEHIAGVLEVDINLVQDWATEWSKIKASHRVSKDVLSQNAYNQILAIDRDIKENDNRPTSDQLKAKTELRKFVETLQAGSIHQHIDTLTMFSRFLMARKPELCKAFVELMDEFIKDLK